PRGDRAHRQGCARPGAVGAGLLCRVRRPAEEAGGGQDSRRLRHAAGGPMIDGDCDPRFAAVRDAFAAGFDAGREVGASFAATVDGCMVVDVWGGHADVARTRPWRRDTIVNVFSTTKAMNQP